MLFYYALPLSIGVMIVVQGGLNQKIGAQWGLGWTLLMNSLQVLLISALFYGILRWTPESFPPFLRPRTPDEAPSWWYLVPGFCGFGVVLGLPWAIQGLGAAKSIIVVIAAQICAGLVWDFMASGMSPSLLKVAGAALTILGSLFVIFG